MEVSLKGALILFVGAMVGAILLGIANPLVIQPLQKAVTGAKAS